MKINNLKDVLPIFNEKCQIKFKNLKKFEFSSNAKQGISIDVLKNIKNNIDCMENLESFKICCFVDEIDQDFYKEFIAKFMNSGFK